MRSLRRPGLRILIALAAGALHALSFAPWNLPWLQLLALAVLFMLAARTQRVRSAAALGFAFGLGWFGVGVSWVYISMHVYGLMPAAMAGLATAAFCAFLALVSGACAGGGAAFGSVAVPAADPGIAGDLGAVRMAARHALHGLSVAGQRIRPHGWAARRVRPAARRLRNHPGRCALRRCARDPRIAAERTRRARLCLVHGGAAVTLVGGAGLGQQRWTHPAGAPHYACSWCRPIIPQDVEVHCRRAASDLRRPLVTDAGARADLVACRSRCSRFHLEFVPREASTRSATTCERAPQRA